MLVREIWIGLDWGTHSSKWWYTVCVEDGRLQHVRNPGPVVNSTVYRDDDRLFLTCDREGVHRLTADPRLKRRLIEDPLGADYWEARRAGIGVSLGSAACLSLSVLLGAVAGSLRQNSLQLHESCPIHLCFSLPNWVGEDPAEQAARRRMFETTVVVCALVLDRALSGMPSPGDGTEISAWAADIERLRNSVPCRAAVAQYVPTFEGLVRGEFAFERMTPLSWRLAAESCAAGFPELKPLLLQPSESRRMRDHQIKLLVVDVGAGSTDVGYFVSTRNLARGECFLQYLPPAPTLEYAGERLTELLRSNYASLGRRMTTEEAELHKLSAPEQWRDAPFAREWRGRIAEYVAGYVSHIPDERFLRDPYIPGLRIVMTGGSGLVDGLGEAVRERTVEALQRRFPLNAVAEMTRVSDSERDAPIQDPIDRARRAVSLGAGDPELADLSYREAFQAPGAAPL